MGPLSYNLADGKDGYKTLDTAKKREASASVGRLRTGKTELKHSGRKGSPVSVENAPKNLARRIRSFDAVKDKGGFHRPGSNKK